MRDINRIDNFCAELAELWKKQPDMRFGQFISNVFGEVVNSSKMDIWFLEDEQIMKYLKDIEWLKKE